MEYEITTDSELEKEGRRPRKYANAPRIFRLWGDYPKWWSRSVPQLASAQALFEERGITEIIDAIEWYDDMKKRFSDDKFFPSVNSPNDLDTKWDKLEAFNEKHA